MKVENQNANEIVLRIDLNEVMQIMTGLGYKAAVIEYVAAHSPMGQHPHYEGAMKMGAEVSVLAFGSEGAWKLVLDSARDAQRISTMLAKDIQSN